MPLGRVPPLALRLRHQVVCSPHTVASLVPPVLSPDRFCGTPHWRLGTGATEAWSSGLQAAQYLRSSLVDQLQSSLVAVLCVVLQVRKVVFCCISSNKHKKQWCPTTTKECGARRFVMYNGDVWHCGSVA